ncbi:MAG: SurA N-terminal domain-containing protein [Geobacteraceae bacterium]|nr:SurA N-terminal domain-containing protein [Geobacteraceae bacterium]
MLGIMRKYKQSIIIKAVFSIIVLSFVGTIFLIWGEGGEGLKGSGYAVKVNGEKIAYDDYLKNYENAKNSIRQIYGQPVTPEIEKQLNLRKTTLDNLINTTLVRQEAKKMGIKVSDEEMVDAISKMPYFQKDGVFDKKLYEQVLSMNHLTPSNFENSIRQDLIVSKAGKSIADKVTLTEQDLLQHFKKTNDKIELQFISIAPADVRNSVTVTDEELNAYLQQHAKEYMTREEIKLSFLLLTPAKLLPKLSVSNDEIQTYYQKNIDRYQGKDGILPLEAVKERVKGDALTFKAAKQAYEQVAIALNKNLAANDLLAAARMLDVPVSETPLFSQQNIPAALAGESDVIKKAFATKQGELGGPLETQKGVYLFKVTARNPSIVPPLAKVRSEIEKKVIDQKSFELARKKAEEALQKMQKGEYSGTLQTTGIFSYSGQGKIPSIGTSRDAMEAAMLLKPATPVAKTPFSINGRWYAMRLKERIEADSAGFQKEKENIRRILLPRKQQEAQEAWLKGLRDKAKIVINPALTTD